VKDKKIKKLKTQFLPKPIFIAFKKMKEAMRKDVGDTVNVVSGYRSPAYQALVLFLILVESNWSLLRTLKRVTLPGCSEHGNASCQAVDVAPERGIRWLRNFDRTREYIWLSKNAKSFGFEMSYSEGNKYGVIFEPWHWRYVKK
jgi:D-alanyl-D-alanine carboxypeptidase